MGNYAIIDTGYANKAADGTQETRANSGDAIVFNSSKLSLGSKSGKDDAANPSRFEESEINQVSVSNRVFMLNGVVDRQNASYPDLCNSIYELTVTKGLKLLYYTTTTDGYFPMFNSMSQTTHGSLTTPGGFKSMLVRVTKYSIVENPTGSLARYSLTIEVTNPTD